MKLRAEQLAQHLDKQPGLIYIISGDEPLLMQEAVDLFYKYARKHDYLERIIIEADHSDAWQRFAHEQQHLSLFSNKRVIECRLKPGKLGDLGSKSLVAYAQHPSAETLLLVITPKLTAQQQAAQWYKALDKAGYTLQLWPISPAQFPQWLKQRLQQAGLKVDSQGIHLLATHVEGNLLAAAQEIEKLRLLYGENSISVEQIANAITGNNRFDIFNLIDSVLSGDVIRSVQILDNLRSEGNELPLVLWGLAREIRILSSMSYELNRGAPLSQVLQKSGIWEQRKPIMQRALQRHSHDTWLQLIQFSTQVDRMIKGIIPGNPWDEIQQLCVAIAGKSLFPTAIQNSNFNTA